MVKKIDTFLADAFAGKNLRLNFPSYFWFGWEEKFIVFFGDFIAEQEEMDIEFLLDNFKKNYDRSAMWCEKTVFEVE